MLLPAEQLKVQTVKHLSDHDDIYLVVLQAEPKFIIRATVTVRGFCCCHCMIDGVDVDSCFIVSQWFAMQTAKLVAIEW